MTGYWTINQGGNARRKMLCPTETHPIDIKVTAKAVRHFQNYTSSLFVSFTLILCSGPSIRQYLIRSLYVWKVKTMAVVKMN